jgi:hypothetical protein
MNCANIRAAAPNNWRGIEVGLEVGLEVALGVALIWRIVCGRALARN